MISTYAVTFPGQGAQYVGMGRELIEESKKAREIFERASERLDLDMIALCTEGPSEKLSLTEYTQPALLTLSIAVWEVLKAQGISEPAMAAGLSLGEYTALVAAGALEFEDACWLVRQRGRYMQEAVPKGVGAMAAVIGLTAEEVGSVCAELGDAHDGVIGGANFNCPGQVVISGHRELVLTACAKLKERGAKRAVVLDVSAPFHSPLMEPARDRLAEAMEAVTFEKARFPVIGNAWVRPIESPTEIREALLLQMTAPVEWESSVRWMLDQGVETFVEAGPGRTLTGFLRRIERSANGLNCEGPDEIKKVAESL